MRLRQAVSHLDEPHPCCFSPTFCSRDVSIICFFILPLIPFMEPVFARALAFLYACHFLPITVYAIPFFPGSDRYRQTSSTIMETRAAGISDRTTPAGTDGFLARVMCG